MAFRLLGDIFLQDLEYNRNFTTSQPSKEWKEDVKDSKQG